MRCVVTAGPTYEPLDQVRRLTNFSTGRLGSELAAFLSEQGHEVTLLLGEQATWRSELPGVQVEPFTTTADLSERLPRLSTRNIDAVFHAAAVSDFAFGRTWVRSPQGELAEVKSGKLSTRQGTLLAELVPTPKLISNLRDWFPKALLVGWKFEVDGDRAAALEAARAQLAQSRSDACVINGPAYGPGFGLLRPPTPLIHCEDKPALFRLIAGSFDR